MKFIIKFIKFFIFDRRTAVLPAAAAAFLLSVNAANTYSFSDPAAVLSVSEAILRKGVIHLSHRSRDDLLPVSHVLQEKNGKLYYYFPAGTSLFSIPFAAFGIAAGKDMIRDNEIMQKAAASVLAAITVFFLYKISLLYSSPLFSAVFSFLFWAGTSLSGTNAAALWSHNYTVIWALVSIYAVLYAEKKQAHLNWLLLGTALFASFITRPVMALFIPAVLVYAASFDFRSTLKAAAVSGILLLLYFIYNIHEFGRILPDYYRISRLGNPEFFQALAANLVSPSRGLFLFSPFLAFSLLLFRKKLTDKEKLLLSLMGLWFVLHLAAVSHYPHWWAGHSYGPRFMTDVLPGLYVMILSVIPENPDIKDFLSFRGAVTAVSLAVSVFIQSYQGLYNTYTFEWNREPDIDRYPHLVWDFNYPQSASDPEGHRRRMLRLFAGRLTEIEPGQVHSHTSEELLFVHWSFPEKEHRWTLGKESFVYFRTGDPENFKGKLTLEGGSLAGQKIIFLLNGHEISRDFLSSWEIRKEILFSPDHLKKGLNELKLLTPDAARPGNGDTRVLSFAFRKLVLE